MDLVYGKTNFMINWSENCTIFSAVGKTKFATIDKKLCVSVLIFYFQEHYKLIVKDLSKQQALDADPKAIQQIYFARNLERYENEEIFFIIEKVKETILGCSQGTVKLL